MGLSFFYFQFAHRVCNKIFKGNKFTVFGKKILDEKTGCKIIEDLINSPEPCMIGRMGTVEAISTTEVFNVKHKIKKHVKQSKTDVLYNNAGFFPKTEEAVFKFTDVYCEACKSVDVVAMFGPRCEEYILHKYAKNPTYINFTALEPYYFDQPWSRALKGKKVLVVNPLAETIESQYRKREVLFENQDVLPEFTLKTVKAVQSIGDNTGGFDTWFDALDHMKEQISKTDFDVALIGCGAYSFPLAAYCKELGKKSVIIGGATQILFGIKGKRWDNIPEISKMFNEHWVYPDKSDIPAGYKNVEGGCYW